MMWLCLTFAFFAAATLDAVKLAPDTTPEEYALKYNLEYLPEATVNDWYVFRSSGYRATRAHLQDKAVVAHEKQRVRAQHTRSAPISDPLYSAQWHLHGNEHSVDMPEDNTLGSGVVVAIVDDGFQHRHPDLQHNYSPQLSYDYNDKDGDPAPNVYNNDGHGTSAAGVCGAVRHNNHCGQGVAPGVTLAGIRLIARGTYDYEEAQGLSHKRDQIHMYSNSWGPEDSGRDLMGPGRITREALEKNFAESNNIYVWAGGNGRQNKDNGNYDGYANHYATIAIGALDSDGRQSWYSEDCACLFAVAPSSGSGDFAGGITTVDLLGPYGYASGECTRTFGGTSSAAPLAAGILAIVKSKHPYFTPRDVMHVIAKASTKVDEESADWSTTGHSHHYGFGLLKIPALLAAAETHQLVPPMKTTHSNTVYVNEAITATSSVTLTIPAAMQFVEQVLCEVSFYHARRGDVRIVLEHEGVRSILADSRDDTHSGVTTWTYSSVRHWGQSSSAASKWALHVTDTSGRVGRGQIRSAKVTLLGH